MNSSDCDELTLDPLISLLFPLGSHDQFNRATEYACTLAGVDLQQWDEFGDPGFKLRLSWLPNNLGLILPHDPAIQGWPYIFLKLILPWESYVIDRDPYLRYLLPLIRSEIELILENYESLLRDHETHECAAEEAIFEISRLIGDVIVSLVRKCDRLTCAEWLKYWQRYLTNTAGCIDSDGILDRERAAAKTLKRAWRSR